MIAKKYTFDIFSSKVQNISKPFFNGGKMIEKKIINPNRIRKIDESFCYIPHRFLRHGFLSVLTHDELLLYLFFVLAADSKGLSFYNHKTIIRILNFNPLEYQEALDGLIKMNLIEAKGTLVQVLDLPNRPITRCINQESPYS